MLADVFHYDALGEHRTAGPADEATSQWLAERLAACGLAVDLPRFASPLYTPADCRIETGEGALAAFPAWPPQPTAAAGMTAALALADGDVRDRIALARSPRSPGGGWAVTGLHEPVLAAFARGAVAVVVLTDGPTGEVIALNATPAGLRWPGPVALVGTAVAERLLRHAAAGAAVTLVSQGETAPDATASNVVARRAARGPTVVVSTPKSGWFQCAGERASGLAVFLEAARWLVGACDASLVFAAFSGHELAYRGGAAFLADGAPAPDETRLWLHIGANAAMRDLAFEGGAVVERAGGGPFRRVTASEALTAAAASAFDARAGYLLPAVMSAANAAGEMTLVHPAGYRPLAAIGGPNPLFHTRLDRADVATTAAGLAAVAGAVKAFLTTAL